MAYVTLIFLLITYLFGSREMKYVEYRCFMAPVARSVSPAKMDQLSVGRHWRLSRVYGGIARRNTMDSRGDTSDSAADTF